MDILDAVEKKVRRSGLYESKYIGCLRGAWASIGQVFYRYILKALEPPEASMVPRPNGEEGSKR